VLIHRPDNGAVDLTYPSDAVVVVAGVPGAGKTTLLRRVVDRTIARVVDTDDRPRRGPLLYPAHYARIALAIAGRRPVVIHSRGTMPAARRTIALLARLRGRPAHLVLLNADRATAEAGQRHRGRTVSQDEMNRQVERWHRLIATGVPDSEGWASVQVLDREGADQVTALSFVPVAQTVPQLA
jgi:GTPase SAR1 family protein